MMGKKRNVLALLVAPILLFGLTVSVPAQPLLNGEAVGDWKFECIAVTQQENRCAITQAIMLEGATTTLARISLSGGESDSQIVVSILTPLAVQIETGTALIVGDNGIEFPYVACFAEGCLARGSVEGDVFRDFIIDEEMGVAYSSFLAEGPTIVPASARGLLEALDRALLGSGE
jgi:invasion protein IalB